IWQVHRARVTVVGRFLAHLLRSMARFSDANTNEVGETGKIRSSLEGGGRCPPSAACSIAGCRTICKAQCNCHKVLEEPDPNVSYAPISRRVNDIFKKRPDYSTGNAESGVPLVVRRSATVHLFPEHPRMCTYQIGDASLFSCSYVDASVLK
ncbi:unnamed protein product, partial [Rangifer tarandus platyrhynchus]